MPLVLLLFLISSSSTLEWLSHTSKKRKIFSEKEIFENIRSLWVSWHGQGKNGRRLSGKCFLVFFLVCVWCCQLSYLPSHLVFPRWRITGLDFSSTATPLIWPTSNSIEGQFKIWAGFLLKTSVDALYFRDSQDKHRKVIHLNNSKRTRLTLPLRIVGKLFRSRANQDGKTFNSCRCSASGSTLLASMKHLKDTKPIRTTATNLVNEPMMTDTQFG